ncbi:MAG TPA: 4Fe-4S dicluster domain-containing protein [Candidatus Desulfovibrio intestinavium]|uniref:4Fe-4S dicluster domain-containing protein n=2 Tax=Desulfovibrio TaxID=872 RepID=A0A9D2HMD0_9BACT|nr:4Fe-4S dicluster domain-containing protein [Candidatus Desulfovibrio intestinavium]
MRPDAAPTSPLTAVSGPPRDGSAAARERLLRAGNHAALTCLQCGSCSVVCPHASVLAPWPRKEMLWLGLGDDERLAHDPDIWLCRDCGHCARLCPRGADPAAVMAALRVDACRRLSGGPRADGPSGRAAARLAGLPGGLFLLALLGWCLIWLLRAVQLGTWLPGADAPDRLRFAALYPVALIDAIFLLTAALVLLVLARGARRQWRAYAPPGRLLRLGRRTSLLRDLLAVLRDGLGGRDFARCRAGDELLPAGDASAAASNRQRRGHLLLTLSLLGLAGVSGAVALGHWAGLLRLDGAFATPLPVFGPLKLLANLAALALLAGLWQLLRRRREEGRRRHLSPEGRRLLLLFLWVTLSGLAAQGLRLAQLAFGAYAVYTVHLALVWTLFASLPWSPLAHAVYRSVALLHVRHRGRVPLAAPPLSPAKEDPA